MTIGSEQMRKQIFTSKMNTLQRIAILSLASVAPFVSASALARSPGTDAKLKGVLANCDAVTPQILRDPANADLIAELKLLAQHSGASLANVLLIKLGDESAIRSCVVRFHSDRQRMATNQMIRSGNPKIISFLAEDFNKPESAEGTFVGSDKLKFPVSMAAAWVVKNIILKSPDFSREVKEWAKTLPELQPGLRTGIRAWWETNRAALLREDYPAVKVP